MIEPLLQSQLAPVVARHRRLCFWRILAIGLLITGCAALLTWGMSGWIGFGERWAFLVSLAGSAVSFSIARKRSRRWSPDFRSIARQIEQRHPELHALLVTAVEQQPDPATGRLEYLQERVIREASAETGKHQWLDVIPGSAIASMCGLAWIAAIALVVLSLRTWNKPGPAGVARVSGERLTELSVMPGDSSIEKGETLVVLVRFPRHVPTDATLVVTPADRPEQRIPLAKSLGDPVFGGTVPDVATDLRYRIEYGKNQTRSYTVKVFDHPRLERSDAELRFPEYTALEPKKIEDTRRVTAVEGSRLDFSLQFNKPVTQARLVSEKGGKTIPLRVDPSRPTATLDNFLLETSEAYQLQLVDVDGRTNKVASRFVVEVSKNRPPELKLAAPRGDQRVSPLQEMNFQAEFSDDFGLRSFGLAYTVAGQQTKFIQMDQPAGPLEKKQFQHLLPLEELGVKPDELISYYLWAEDIGPDGKVRRTEGDMYFAEVRPFEEIFREAQGGDQPSEPQQGQGQGNQATKLAELQKQIISATWKLQRQKDTAAQYQKDSKVVHDSQEKALEQVESMKSQVREGRASSALTTASQQMEKALEHLAEAANSKVPLPSALEAEQAAYQALLKLQAREYEVAQRRRGQSGQGQNQQSEQQLDQLELKEDENRYETQRQAAPQATPEQREQLQTLNRLKELAQRQQDLNERLKELQNALQEARTEKEKEDLRRQLKRLRDEEREMLADVDEMRQKMESASARSAEERKQLEQTRSEVQRAAEALDKEDVSKALAAGTRAERELEQMRDDVRKKNAKQFTEETREMRAEARDLSRKQGEIGEKLNSISGTTQKTLSDSGESKELADQLAKQRSALTNLLSQMSRVSQEAESSEPLLAKELHDAVRKTSQDNLEQTLKTSEQLLTQSFPKEAEKFEQRARTNIEDLKDRVERAAETVLGDETEALKLARAELDALSDQLEKEMAQAQGSRGGAGTNEVAGNAAQGRATTNGAANLSSGPGNLTKRYALAANNRGSSFTNRSERANSNVTGQTNTLTAQTGNSSEDGKRPGEKPGQPGESSAVKSGEPSEAGDRAQTEVATAPGQSREPGKPGESGKGGERAQSESPGESGQAGKGNPGAQASDGNKPGESQPGTSPSSGKGQQQGQPGQQAAADSSGKAPSPTERQPTEGANNRARIGVARSGAEGGTETRGGSDRFFERDGDGRTPRPITGDEYRNWADRLGNVEELLDQPELRAELSRIRDRARALRMEFKREGREPQWALVNAQVAAPLAEVRQRVAEEIARRGSKEALVPIDRDPVPDKFSDLVRRYYEKLGSSE